MKLTLDTNCIVDLEEGSGEADALLRIVEAHAAGRIVLRVAGISASERQPSGGYAPTFTPFQDRLRAAGLASAEILRPMVHLDTTYLDQMVLADERMLDLERQIHEILFPELEFQWEDFCRKRGFDPVSTPLHKKWRNAECDVVAMWCHINYGGDVFVTTDRNFHKQSKKPRRVDPLRLFRLR